MIILSPQDIVRIWETGKDEPDWRRALLILAPALPELSQRDLNALSVGQRNAYLFAVRKAVVGPVMRARVQCPACYELLEFEQVIAELIEDYDPPTRREWTFEHDGYAIRCRTRLSGDPLAPTAEAARTDSLADLITAATRAGSPVSVNDLPDHIVEEVGERLNAADPLARVTLSLRCAFCEHVWDAILDIVTYLWAELDTRARTLLEDVVSLARHYGWAESEILAMTPARRGFYLDAIQ